MQPAESPAGATSESFDALIESVLNQRAEQSLLRNRIAVRHTGPVTLEIDGRSFINFCSNNYLGLTHHPKMLAAMSEAPAAGSGAAGLISGYTQAHRSAEETIAQWKRVPAALLMPSGYQANLAIVQTFAGIAEARGKRVRFLIDKLAHASLIDAIRQAGASFRIFPHNGLEKLRRLLDASPPDEVQIVLTESIFSMDGDPADFKGLASLKAERPFVLCVDEAHGSGVYGTDGSGLIEAMELCSAVDVSLVTFSKALGSSGAAICGSAAFIKGIQNFGRAYVYSTAVPPIVARLAETAIDICRTEPGLRTRLAENIAHVRSNLVARGLIAQSESLAHGDSPIIPIVLGGQDVSLRAANFLNEHGLLVTAVRPPTVPRGTSRLRLTISAAHEPAQLQKLLHAMKGLKETISVSGSSA